MFRDVLVVKTEEEGVSGISRNILRCTTMNYPVAVINKLRVRNLVLDEGYVMLLNFSINSH